MSTELIMDTRIVWDPCRLKQIDEAKKKVLGYLRQGYEVLTADGQPVERFIPSLGEVLVKTKKMAKSIMRILCDKGDERLVWDKNKGKEAKEAKNKFVELIGKGYKAYSVNAQGEKKRPIEEFDVDAEEIIMIPPTARG